MKRVDFLKYIDIGIGLALVMVLVSPLVTAATQFWMWIRNRRSVFLKEMIERLLSQLGGPRAVLLEVTDGPNPATGISLGPLNQITDDKGRIALPGPLPPEHHRAGVISLVARDQQRALAGLNVTARFIPQELPDVPAVRGKTTNGKASLSYTYFGSPALASRTARISTDASAAKAIVWSLNGATVQNVEVTPGVEATIALPSVTTMPATYDFSFEVHDSAGKALDGAVVTIQFDRNNTGDQVVECDPTDSKGVTHLKVPRVMDPSLVKAVTAAIVQHPQLARTPAPWSPRFFKIPPLKNRHAEVIQREELIRVLLELAANDGAGAKYLSAEDRNALKQVLAMNGILDAGATLKALRAATQRLEKDQPSEAAHVRNTIAIVETAQSELVGKITQWFDAASARATQQYAAEARAITVVAALLVALGLQLDAAKLLNRLSVDPEFRAAMVKEAEAQDKRVDEAKKTAEAAAAKIEAERKKAAEAAEASKAKQAAGENVTTQSPNAATTSSTTPEGAAEDPELAVAKAKREEIEKNLATLRKPSFSIIPDQFAWEPLAVGRVDQNPMWGPPYPQKLTLIAGGETKALQVRWRRNVLDDLKLAIDDSKAPVKTAIISPGGDVLLHANQRWDVSVAAGATRLEVPLDGVVRAVLEKNILWPKTFDYAKRTMHLLVDEKAHPLEVPASSQDTILGIIEQQIAGVKAPVTTACYGGSGRPLKTCTEAAAAFLAITANSAVVRDLRLLWNPEDPLTNVLHDPGLVYRAWRVPAAALKAAKGDVAITLRPFHADVKTDPIVVPKANAETAQAIVAHYTGEVSRRANPKELPTAAVFPGRQLVLTGKKKGPIELRVVPDQPTTNIVNTDQESAYPLAGLFTGSTDRTAFMGDAAGFGLLLSWVLLSFGGPFWYDALKNLLKLRPSAAAMEEKARNERAAQPTTQTQTQQTQTTK